MCGIEEVNALVKGFAQCCEAVGGVHVEAGNSGDWPAAHGNGSHAEMSLAELPQLHGEDHLI